MHLTTTNASRTRPPRVRHGREPEQLRRHEEAVARGESGYLDPETGLFVLTASFLAERGYCCGRGCRHCPYPADAQRAAGRVVVDERPPDQRGVSTKRTGTRGSMR
ncbi:MAG: hypothetical protein HC923_00660 [Myxococcales bacterium]|nr:hypothetical protein [Myxococcales bacterium]